MEKWIKQNISVWCAIRLSFQTSLVWYTIRLFWGQSCTVCNKTLFWDQSCMVCDKTLLRPVLWGAKTGSTISLVGRRLKRKDVYQTHTVTNNFRALLSYWLDAINFLLQSNRICLCWLMWRKLSIVVGRSEAISGCFFFFQYDPPLMVEWMYQIRFFFSCSNLHLWIFSSELC